MKKPACYQFQNRRHWHIRRHPSLGLTAKLRSSILSKAVVGPGTTWRVEGEADFLRHSAVAIQTCIDPAGERGETIPV